MKDRAENKTGQLTEAERHKRFVETAKKVEASKRQEDFDAAFDKVVNHPPVKGGARPSLK